MDITGDYKHGWCVYVYNKVKIIVVVAYDRGGHRSVLVGTRAQNSNPSKPPIEV
jgi:hypothetical protein